MRRRRWLQFSLSSVFLLVTVLGVWLGIVVNQARKQREAVAAIEAAGGAVAYDYEMTAVLPATKEPPGPRWLRNIFGDEYFQSVKGVDLHEAKISDELFEQVGGLTTIERLLLANSNVGDHELAYLAGLHRLEFLSLLTRRDPPQISPAGLEHLWHLPRLGTLDLPESPISDAGLAIIADIKSLRSLCFSDPQVTDAGIEYLTSLPELTDLWIDKANITDRGLEHIAKLKTLHYLTVETTAPDKLTDAGLAHLATLSELESLNLRQCAITDAGLRSLKELSKLKNVHIIRGRATKQGAEELQQAIPGCKVLCK